MPPNSPSALASAADARRRQLPASAALAILTGGLAAAILGGAGPVAWAGMIAVLFVADAELYRRLDLAEARLDSRLTALLAGWAFLTSAFYAVLPAALWLDGEAAGAAAAMIMWIAGVVRHFDREANRSAIALAGAAPPAIALLASPLMTAAATARTDWDLALIAAVGGGALMVYVAQARWRASEAERKLAAASAEQDLRQTLARLLFDQGALTAVLVDPAGRILEMSPGLAKVLDNAAVGASFEAVIPWSSDRWRTTHRRAMAGEIVRHGEDQVRDRGKARWFEWEARPWRAANGEILGVLAFAREVSALVEARCAAVAAAEAAATASAQRQAADAANVSKSQFLASMSHELRTPLNAIIGYSEILEEEAQADGRESDCKDVACVLSSARQLLQLINGILDLSKIEAGRVEISCSDFDLGELVAGAVATALPAAHKNGNIIRVDCADAGPVRGDAFKLNQCLLNLLSNAAKFTSNGAISVTARRKQAPGGELIEIAVSDNGIGMNEEQMARVFEAFVQAEAATARQFGGTGLGLALTRRMMQLLGGTVSVASTPGNGATFTLTFPALLNSGADAPAHDGAVGAGDGRGRLALVIDDEESARDLASRALARLGFAVREAASGAVGLEMARALRPDIILLDINLPDMAGWEVLMVLRTGQALDIPVIVHSVEDNRQRALAEGACELLVKPADRDVLTAAVLRFARAPSTSLQFALTA